MNEYQLVSWIALGLIPYRVKWHYLAGGYPKVEIRALFWSLIVQQGRDVRYNWQLRILLIEKLRDTVWAVVTRLKPEDEGEE